VGNKRVKAGEWEKPGRKAEWMGEFAGLIMKSSSRDLDNPRHKEKGMVGEKSMNGVESVQNLGFNDRVLRRRS